MERFQDPERLAALFARCRISERLPWTAAYPWTLQYYEKGEYLCRLREPMESLYLLLEGGIQTSLTNAAGRTRLVATAQPGELVGGDVGCWATSRPPPTSAPRRTARCVRPSHWRSTERLYAPTWGFCAMPPGGWPALW